MIPPARLVCVTCFTLSISLQYYFVPYFFFQAVYPWENKSCVTGRQTKEGISRSFSASCSANLPPKWLMECKIHSSSLISLSLRYNLCWCSGERKKTTTKEHACPCYGAMGSTLKLARLHAHAEHLFMGDPWAIKQLLELIMVMFSDSDVGSQSILIILTTHKEWVTTQ